MDRSSDGHLNLSAVETERFLADLVDAELKLRKAAGTYKGAFSVVCSFLGYQVLLPQLLPLLLHLLLGQFFVAVCSV